MQDWLTKAIGDDVIYVFEGFDVTEDALRWLRARPRTFGELRAQDIDWLRWMAANTDDRDLLEKLAGDAEGDVGMWVACNPMTSEEMLGRLAEDAIVFVRRGVAQNRCAAIRLLTRLCDDDDVVVRTLALRNLISRSDRRDSLRKGLVRGVAAVQDAG